MQVRQFLVLPRLPERIHALQELAHNLWYCWNWDMVKLFIRLDPEMWEQCYQNPVSMLAQLPQETLERAARDDAFVASLSRVYDRYLDYIKRKKWYHYKYGDLEDNTIAYFSLEYGMDTGLPVYSGGLGILSGDTIKSASDLGLPIVSVGLLYRYGYFRQLLSADGWQQERYEENDWYHMPVKLVKDKNDQPLKVSVNIDGTPVFLQIWRVDVGVVPLFLLDSNIPDNSLKFREITSVLYGGDKEMRIRQEIVLGIGGVHALRALGIDPIIYHINEGHSWFLTLERIRRLMHEDKLSFDQASQYIWSTTVFTTHTPVPAGNERFDSVLIKRYLGPLLGDLGITGDDFLSLGRVFPDDESESFCMTVAALKYAAFANGVSQLHGRVSRDMWHNIWPNLPREDVPITAITNGAHASSWISHDHNELYISYFGPRYTERPGAPEVWKDVYNIPDAELWRVHNRRRERLVFFARKRLKLQLARRSASQPAIREADQLLDPQLLTIGFARRFSTYKRGTLIFSDLDRLDRILNDEKRPVQLVIAGKAHPLDTPGKEIIKQIIAYSSEERFHKRIIFLEDYDINVARYLVQGVDVWLNNPRRPEEASGTSGMKAAFNGALNLSILDGWWDEAYDDTVGFKIGNGEEYDNVEIQDRLDADMLYQTLETEVVPLFYARDGGRVPTGWVQKMKASIHMAGERFSAHRMLMDYADQCYVPAQRAALRLRENNYEATRQVSDWMQHMRHNWDSIAIEEVRVPDIAATVYVGQQFPISLQVRLGEISPADVDIEIISGRLNSQEQVLDTQPKTAILADDADNSNGTYLYKGEVTCRQSGRFGITARITPKNDLLPHAVRPRLITWW
ncbi:MAG: alpha-glucan family phosphorylase [Candidatus Zixiibacteriota bacterium]